MHRATAPTLLNKLASGAFVGLLAVAGASAAPSQAAAEEAIVGAASVIDGDTIEIHGTRIRLHGIDAPESRQECNRADGAPWRCGQQAALALSDAYRTCGRALRIRAAVIATAVSSPSASKGSEDLNRWMVASGWAVAYRKYALDYVPDEERAHRAGVGIWAGAFEMPWDWRLEIEQQ